MFKVLLKRQIKVTGTKHHTDLQSICELLLVQLKPTLPVLSTSKSHLNLPFRKLILKSKERALKKYKPGSKYSHFPLHENRLLHHNALLSYNTEELAL